MSSIGSTAVVGLDESTLDKLRELRRLNVDSAKGFDECAQIVKDEGLKRVFTEYARQRANQANALATHIEWNEGVEEERGSYAAAMHRAWIKVIDALTADSAEAALVEAERGEDVIKQAYEEALEEVKDSPIHELVVVQYDAVKKSHDAIRNARDLKQG